MVGSLSGLGSLKISVRSSQELKENWLKWHTIEVVPIQNHKHPTITLGLNRQHGPQLNTAQPKYTETFYTQTNTKETDGILFKPREHRASNASGFHPYEAFGPTPGIHSDMLTMKYEGENKRM